MTIYIQIVKSIKNFINHITNPTIVLNEETTEKTGDLLV